MARKILIIAQVEFWFPLMNISQEGEREQISVISALILKIIVIFENVYLGDIHDQIILFFVFGGDKSSL